MKPFRQPGITNGLSWKTGFGITIFWTRILFFLLSTSFFFFSGRERERERTKWLNELKKEEVAFSCVRCLLIVRAQREDRATIIARRKKKFGAEWNEMIQCNFVAPTCVCVQEEKKTLAANLCRPWVVSMMMIMCVRARANTPVPLATQLATRKPTCENRHS